MLTGARLHAMRPFLLTPSSAPAAPSTLSRLLLPLHLRTRSDSFRVHPASNPHPPNNRTISLLRRGRFFATSPSSQMATPTDASGGADPFEVIRAHQAKAARLPPAEEIRTILDRSVRGVLATHSQEHAGYPSGSVVDFACDQDGSPILAVSSLAIHSKNLSGNPKCSLLVAKDLEDRTDTVITVYGDAVPVSDEEKDSVRSEYLRRHPEAFWVDFGDFSFLHIKPRAVRYVSGVATAILGSGEFSAAEYKEAKIDPISQFSTPITGHMNKDHADETKLIVQHSTNVKCPLCDQADETIQHLLTSCVFTRDFWFRVLSSLASNDVYQATASKPLQNDGEKQVRKFQRIRGMTSTWWLTWALGCFGNIEILVSSKEQTPT